MDFDSTIIWRNMLGDFLYAIAINTFTEEETIYKSIGTVMNYKPFIAHMKNIEKKGAVKRGWPFTLTSAFPSTVFKVLVDQYIILGMDNFLVAGRVYCCDNTETCEAFRLHTQEYTSLPIITISDPHFEYEKLSSYSDLYKFPHVRITPMEFSGYRVSLDSSLSSTHIVVTDLALFRDFVLEWEFVGEIRSENLRQYLISEVARLEGESDTE